MTEPAAAAAPEAAPAADRALRVIAVYKLVTAVLTVALGLATLRLLNPHVAALIDDWATALALRHDRRLLGQFISMVSGLSNRRLHEFAIGAFAVAALFVVEAGGLWMGKRWALYLTVVATTLFVPFEVVQLARMITLVRCAALLLNLAVVAFLVHRLRRVEMRLAA